MPSTINGYRRLSKRTSKFARKLVTGTLGSEVYALSEMVDHMVLLRVSYTPFLVLGPGMLGAGHCGSLSADLRSKKTAPGANPGQRRTRQWNERLFHFPGLGRTRQCLLVAGDRESSGRPYQG